MQHHIQEVWAASAGERMLSTSATLLLQAALAAPRENAFPGVCTDKQGTCVMDETGLSAIYLDYLACLNAQNWPLLGQFVSDDAIHNGKKIGLSGYQAMLKKDFRDIPDLYFDIQLLVCEPPYISSRLHFDCTPAGAFLGLPVDGRRIVFAENVIYEFQQEKIREVWSVIDKAAIEAQL
jgi:predicted ester cyclase